MVLLSQLEQEAFTIFDAQNKRLPLSPRFTLPFFAELAQMWRAWQNGIPPVPGGYTDQPCNLLAAFAALDAAEGRAQPKGT